MMTAMECLEQMTPIQVIQQDGWTVILATGEDFLAHPQSRGTMRSQETCITAPVFPGHINRVTVTICATNPRQETMFQATKRHLRAFVHQECTKIRLVRHHVLTARLEITLT